MFAQLMEIVLVPSGVAVAVDVQIPMAYPNLEKSIKSFKLIFLNKF